MHVQMRLALRITQALHVDEGGVEELRAGGEIIASGYFAPSCGLLATDS
jgi:hypothetical protein